MKQFNVMILYAKYHIIVIASVLVIYTDKCIAKDTYLKSNKISI